MFTDGYALAIPLPELYSTAVEVAGECGSYEGHDRERCAMAVVQAQACPCLLGAPEIVAAVASEFCARMAATNRGRASIYKRADRPELRELIAGGRAE